MRRILHLNSPVLGAALIFVCLGTTGLPVFAQSTINCHCFLDRSYDPADKFAADEYILATSFNSLLAKSFDIMFIP